MAYFDYNPFGNQALFVEWHCDECGEYVHSDIIPIPQPNYLADNSSDSQTEEEDFTQCDGCGKPFSVYIYSSFGGGMGHVPELPENHYINIFEEPEPYYEEQYEAIISNTEFFETFKREIENLTELNKQSFNNPSLDKTLRKQIYVGTIATMETYLSDAFINTTLNSQEYTKKFVKTFHDFKEHSLTLNDLFDYYDKIEKICRKALLEILYHNLSKLKGMYKDTLDIEIGEIGEPYKAINIRHNLVHRNGKSKDGIEVEINQEIVASLLNMIEEFITKIDNQVREK